MGKLIHTSWYSVVDFVVSLRFLVCCNFFQFSFQGCVIFCGDFGKLFVRFLCPLMFLFILLSDFHVALHLVSCFEIWCILGFLSFDVECFGFLSFCLIPVILVDLSVFWFVAFGWSLWYDCKRCVCFNLVWNNELGNTLYCCIRSHLFNLF